MYAVLNALKSKDGDYCLVIDVEAGTVLSMEIDKGDFVHYIPEFLSEDKAQKIISEMKELGEEKVLEKYALVFSRKIIHVKSSLIVKHLNGNSIEG